MTIDILFVTELQPCGSHGGQFIRCHNILKSLCQHYSVAVVAPSPNPACKLATEVDAWYSLPPYNLSTAAKAKNHYHRLMTRSAWVTALKRIYRQHKPPVVWFDYGHWGHYATMAREFGARAVMGTHNAQADLTRQECEVTPLGKARLALRLFHWTQRTHEHRFFPRFDRIVSVSEANRRYHSQYVGDERSLLIPNYVIEDDYLLDEPIERMEGLVVMTGNFASFQNKHGLNWFLQQVWPQVRQEIPQAQLQLVGRGSEASVDRPDQYPNVTGTGEVPTVTPHLRRAVLTVVPLLQGSGTRFKILESLACQTPVVSTTVGALGLDLVPGESAMLADTEVDFAQTVVSLLKDGSRRSRLARNGLSILRDQYSFDVNTERLRKLIKEVMVE